MGITGEPRGNTPFAAGFDLGKHADRGTCKFRYALGHPARNAGNRLFPGLADRGARMTGSHSGHTGTACQSFMSLGKPEAEPM